MHEMTKAIICKNIKKLREEIDISRNEIANNKTRNETLYDGIEQNKVIIAELEAILENQRACCEQAQ